MSEEEEGFRPNACITCNANPADIIDITELGDNGRRWCCGVCDAVWIEGVSPPGVRLAIILDEGYLP